MKKVIYTAIYGNYDNLLEPKYITPNWEYICFTDNKNLKSDVWNIKYLELEFDNTRNARYVKINYQEVLKDYDLSIWIDSNLQVNCNLDEFVETNLKDNNVSFMMHPDRNCIYQEINACVEYKKDLPSVIFSYRHKLLSEKYPRLNGLIQTNIIIRKHVDDLKEMSELWWKDVLNYSKRDQLSLNYVLWKLNVKYDLFSADVIRKEQFILHIHLNDGVMKKATIRSNYGNNFYTKSIIKSYYETTSDKIDKLNVKHNILKKYSIVDDDTIIYNSINETANDYNTAYLYSSSTYNYVIDNNSRFRNQQYDIIQYIENELTDELLSEISFNYGYFFAGHVKIIKVLNDTIVKKNLENNNITVVKRNKLNIYKELFKLKYFYYIIKNLEYVYNYKYDIYVYSTAEEPLPYNLLNLSSISANKLYYYKRNYWFGTVNVMNDFLQQFENINNYNFNVSFFNNVKNYIENSGVKLKIID